MSIAPPRGPENERGLADNDARPTPGEVAAPDASASSPAASDDTAPFSVADGAAVMDERVDDSGDADALWARFRDEQIALYEAEANLDEVNNPKRSAWLLHEAARLREQRAQNVREAARLYTQSLSRDPTLQANTWALYRLFSSRQSWENVLRLLDAEARFAPLPSAADRADLMLEKGRILEDRLGRDAEAIAAYRHALALSPDHIGAHLALLLVGFDGNDEGVIDAALAGLGTHVHNPELRALFVIELARRQRGSLGVEPGIFAVRVAKAADTLFAALGEAGAEGLLCGELDRLSLLATAVRPSDPLDPTDLRGRVLDLLEAHLADGDEGAGDPALLVAVHREKARMLVARGERDAALALLNRALERLPRHPLLLADLLDFADELGRPDAIAGLQHAGHLPPGERSDEAQVRRAEAAARSGAYGEAMGILSELAPTSPYAALAALVRVRVLARTGDVEGLVTAFVAEADRLCPEGGEANDETVKAEAAHLLVRAGILRSEALADARGAEALLRRALLRLPGYAPAREALRNTLIAAGDVAALAALYEDEASHAADPTRAAHLMRAAYLLHRDLSRDEAALNRLTAHAPPVHPVGAAVERLDATGGRGELRDTLPEALAQLLAAIAAVPEGTSPGRAGELALLGARWIELLGAGAEEGVSSSPERLAQARAFGEAALATEPPVAGAGAFLERHHLGRGEVAAAVEVLVAELRQSVDRTRPEIQRALRFRLALTAAQAEAWALSLAALSPLRRDGDRAAINWSLELARRSGDAGLEAEVLEEASVRAQLTAGGDEAAFLHALAVHQAQHEVGKRSGRTRSPALYQLTGPAVAGPVFAAERALSRLRDVAAEPQSTRSEPRAHREALVAGFSQLADALAGTEIGGELRQDAELLHLAAGGRDSANQGNLASPDSAFEAAAAWVAGVRSGDRTRALAGMTGLAARSEPEGAASLDAQVGIRHLLGGAKGDRGAAIASLRRALAANSALAEVALSDFVADDNSGAAFDGAADDVRAGLHARAQRLAGVDVHEAEGGRGGRALAAALFADLAVHEQRRGDLGEAAAHHARVVELDQRSPAPWLALARVSEAAGDRRARASALLQAASRLRSNDGAATNFAAAATLLDEEGLTTEAGAAWTEVLRRRPTDAAAYARCLALVRGQEDTGPLERLIDFRLAHVEDPQARVALYTERAALRLEQPERREDTIADHRRILALDPTNLGSLRTLARLATESGRPELAADFLGRALAAAPTSETPAELQEQLRAELIAAHVANQDGPAALVVLTEALSARPDDRALRELAVEVGLAEKKWDFVGEQFEKLRTMAETPEDRAAWTVRLGRLHRDQRLDVPAALDAFRSAVRIDPLGEAVRELANTMGELPLPPEDAPLVAEATRALRHSLLPNPLLPRRLESLAMLARSGGLIDLADVAAQLHALLGGPPSRGRSRGLVRTVSLSLIAPPLADVSLRRIGDLWTHLADPIARLHAWDPNSVGIGRNTRVTPGSDPRLAWADAASTAFGLSDLSLHVAGRDDLGIAAFDAPPVLVLGRGVAGGDASVRFRVGRVLALLAQKAALFDRITPEELALDWAAAVYLFTEVADPAVSAAALKAQAKALGKAITRKERKAVEPFVAGFAANASSILAYRNHVLATANRAGLLVSGDLGMTLRVVSQQANPSPADLSTEDSLDVIRFAFGDRFTELRDEMRQRDRVNTGEHGGS